jgi:3-hydroxybutyryl-CoA dehydrogenase
MNPQTGPIGVVGLGLLGRGIAACLLGHGFRVIGFTPTQAEHDLARLDIVRMIREMAERHDTRSEHDAGWEHRFTSTTEMKSLAPCVFVIESAPEDPAIKHRVFSELESIIAPHAVLASNTSSIPITSLQEGRLHPGRVLGMHWAEPSHITRFMEIIRGESTDDPSFGAAGDLARRLGKEPALCRRDVPGFIVNRIGYAMYREACHLIDTGVADADTIDRAVRNTLGLWAGACGPLRWIDLSGGPALYAKAMARVLPTLSNADQVPPAMRKLAEQDARGIANGRGFFDYTPEEARRWESIYRRHAAQATDFINRHFPLED